MSEDSKQPRITLSRREALHAGTAVGALSTLLVSGTAASAEKGRKLFPSDLPHGEWVDFSGEGFSAPVVGVIHRREYPALCGVPLGGHGTGCLDLETSGLFGLCSIFNSHTPRRGAMNWPFLGLNVGG